MDEKNHRVLSETGLYNTEIYWETSTTQTREVNISEKELYP
jgi:hypothetical protein